MKNILELFKAYEKLIRHHGSMGQVIPCCNAHRLLMDAQLEFSSLNKPHPEICPHFVSDRIQVGENSFERVDTCTCHGKPSSYF